MDEVFGRVDTSRIRSKTPQPRILSHGRWPVKKLQTGQTIRFSSKGYGSQVILKIEKLTRSEKMVIISGAAVNDVAFGLDEWVELVTVEEAVGHVG